MSNPLADMEKPEVIFAIGTNMTECHPVAATRLKRALRSGAKMIVADPRRIPLAEAAEKHGQHAIYAIASGRAPHESAYELQKLVRAGFGTNYIDNCSRA